MTIRYTLGCELSYDVITPTVFIFNFEVARMQGHQGPRREIDGHARHPRAAPTSSPISGTAMSAVDAAPGPLHVRYEAEVTLDLLPRRSGDHRRNAACRHSARHQCRSCCRRASCRRIGWPLSPFREFGKLPKGHVRVTAICNWLYDNIDYQRGSADEQTTADESLLLRAGCLPATSRIWA